MSKKKKWSTKVTTTVHGRKCVMEITVDWEELARLMARKAVTRKSKKSTIMFRSVKAKVVREYAPKDS